MFDDVVVTSDVAGAFSARVAACFASRGTDEFVLALTGGPLARSCYERLAELGDPEIDWWMVDVLWSDECCVAPDHPDSHERLVREALLERVGAANAVHPMRCDEGADAYQMRVAEYDRIHLVHVVVNADGSVGSLFPATAAMDHRTGTLVAPTRDPSGIRPHDRLTLTPASLSRAGLVLVTASGEEALRSLTPARRGEGPAVRALAGANVAWILESPAQ